MTRQHLAERGGTDTPRTGLRHSVLERAADAELGDGTLPPLPARASLITEAAQIVPALARQVAEPWDVEPRWPAAVDVAVLMPREVAVGAAAEMVIHQVVTELSGAAPQPAGPDVGRGPHEDPRRVQRRRAEEDHAGRVLGGLPGHRIEDAHAARALAIAVVHEVGHDRECLERQPPRGLRRRKRRRLRAEIGAEKAPEPARVPVLTRPSPRE